MRVVVFDVSGPMAHFRRFYSSVTPLTYHFPPRNTIAGILACILGYERDSYYEIFSREKARIGVALRSPVRRVMLPTDYLNTDMITREKLRGLDNRVPTSVEYLLPVPPHENVSYRVFVSHVDLSILGQLERRIAGRHLACPVSLGPANCLADVNLVYYGESETVNSEGEGYSINTIIPQDVIVDGPTPVEGIKVMIEERLPPDFREGRTPSGASRNYVFEASGKSLRVKIKGEVFSLETAEGKFHGVFM